MLEENYYDTLSIKSALYSILHKLADEKLKAMVSLTNSKYHKLRGGEFIETAEGITKTARANLFSLG